ncbi:hypothetical protein ES703_97656 [subsurface metagenome]
MKHTQLNYFLSLDKAWKVISEIEYEGPTVNKYKEIIKIMIEQVSKGNQVELNNFPFPLRRIIERSEEIMFLLKLFKGFKIN